MRTWHDFFDRHRWLLICLSAVFLLSLIPFVPFVISGRGLHGAANPTYFDAMYTSMVREVADGQLLVGNAFYFEHREGVALVPSLPFVLSALPLIAGIPIGIAVAFNFTFWSLIFAAALYALFKRLGLTPIWIALSTILVYISLYGQLQRPVSMQLVHPVFLLFILAFLVWWEQPKSICRAALLGVAAAFAIYDYPFLLQVTAAFLGLVFIYLVYIRDWGRVHSSLIVGLCTSILCIPFLLLMYL